MRYPRVVAALILLVGLLTIAPPASAKVQRSGSLVYVTENALVRDGVGSPNVEAQCPTGSTSVGAGGAFSRPSSDARLSNLLLLDTIGSQAQGFNAAGGDRTITSVAVCLRAPLSDTATYLVGAVGGTIGSGAVAVTCGGTDTRLGGGAGATPAASGRTLIDASPPTGTSTFAGFFTGPPVAGTFFAARVSCIDDGILVKQDVSSSATVPPGKVRSARARCPRGTQVTGGGVDTVTGFSSSRPIDAKRDSDRTPDDGWSAVVPNPTGVDQTFTVHAVCVRRPA